MCELLTQTFYVFRSQLPQIINFLKFIHNFTLVLVVEPGKPVWKKIRQHFGDEVFNDDQTLNRDKLGQVIFDDVEKRRLLNRLTHPVRIKEID